MESEKEKMGTGRLYDANYDTELIAERQACKELCYTLNHLPPSQIAEREAIIRRLFCKTKERFLKQIPHKKRADYFLMSKLRMRDPSGKYIPILHRMFYVATHSNDSMWLALCLYNLSVDPTMSCRVINSTNGQVIELEKQDCSKLLSDREKTILQLIDMGKTSHEIARELFISKNTVSRHRQNILEKLQVKNSIEACRIAKELKLLF
jgi:DNA-binding CsgD family transcriptional regulator